MSTPIDVPMPITEQLLLLWLRHQLCSSDDRVSIIDFFKIKYFWISTQSIFRTKRCNVYTDVCTGSVWIRQSGPRSGRTRWAVPSWPWHCMRPIKQSFKSTTAWILSETPKSKIYLFILRYLLPSQKVVDKPNVLLGSTPNKIDQRPFAVYSVYEIRSTDPTRRLRSYICRLATTKQRKSTAAAQIFFLNNILE